MTPSRPQRPHSSTSPHPTWGSAGSRSAPLRPRGPHGPIPQPSSQTQRSASPVVINSRGRGEARPRGEAGGAREVQRGRGCAGMEGIRAAYARYAKMTRETRSPRGGFRGEGGEKKKKIKVLFLNRFFLFFFFFSLSVFLFFFFPSLSRAAAGLSLAIKGCGAAGGGSESSGRRCRPRSAAPAECRGSGGGPGGLRAPRAMRALSLVALAALCTAASQRRALDVGSRRRWHRVQHGHCSYTFVLPEAEPSPCPLAAPGPVNALQRDSPSGNGHAARGAAQRLQHLERILENSTQWLLKVGGGEGCPLQALCAGVWCPNLPESHLRARAGAAFAQHCLPRGKGWALWALLLAGPYPSASPPRSLPCPCALPCRWSRAPYGAQHSPCRVRMRRCREAAGKAFARSGVRDRRAGFIVFLLMGFANVPGIRRDSAWETQLVAFQPHGDTGSLRPTAGAKQEGGHPVPWTPLPMPGTLCCAPPFPAPQGEAGSGFSFPRSHPTPPDLTSV